VGWLVAISARVAASGDEGPIGGIGDGSNRFEHRSAEAGVTARK
jgi:hypothetical protein